MLFSGLDRDVKDKDRLLGTLWTDGVEVDLLGIEAHYPLVRALRVF